MHKKAIIMSSKYIKWFCECDADGIEVQTIQINVLIRAAVMELRKRLSKGIEAVNELLVLELAFWKVLAKLNPTGYFSELDCLTIPL